LECTTSEKRYAPEIYQVSFDFLQVTFALSQIVHSDLLGSDGGLDEKEHRWSVQPLKKGMILEKSQVPPAFPPRRPANKQVAPEIYQVSFIFSQITFA